ncbi:glutamate--cysteine ligase [Labedella endophytica]|uniref:Putative glutamate--cysteine ligase 2 n=1 Tax=Labedella endophytica TaxID=1523160 RepID=A0A3S0V8F3_9MICO|nr:glutamate--cysteine ligase [Labedella endophytica]RUQ97582.1 glutamate--cysteine ligase [Labedella endophytica]
MQIEFASSDRSTIGLEWELALVDRESGELRSIADDVLEGLRRPDGSEHPRITGELLLNTIELVSDVHRDVPSAIRDLEGQINEVREIIDPLGVELIASGSHPFGQWFDQPITDKERYHKLIDRTRWWGRNMMIWGVHTHVGIEDRDKVMPLLDALLTWSPHVQALSSSSPFWAGVDTGYPSNRALMFQQLPTAGLPYQLPDWSAFERYVDDMTRTGVVDDVTEVRWDIRPAPRWGTVEFRACDSASTLTEFGAVAALIHCLTDHLSTVLDRGEALVSLPPWYVRENKWRAARYGLDAELIVGADGRESLVSDDLRELVGTLADTADRLGCSAELASIVDILDAGASYQRQLRVAEKNGGDLTAVVRSLAYELRHGITGR